MIQPGVYRHYKGQLYQVLFEARDKTNGPRENTRMVVYIGLELDGATEGLRPLVATLGHFNETVEWPDGQRRPRYTRLGGEYRRWMRNPTAWEEPA